MDRKRTLFAQERADKRRKLQDLEERYQRTRHFVLRVFAERLCFIAWLQTKDMGYTT